MGVISAVVVAGALTTSLVMNFKMKSDVSHLEKLTAQLSKEIKENSTENPADDSDDFSEEEWGDDWEEENNHGEVEYEEGDYYHENGELIVIGDEYKIRDFDYIAQAYLKQDMSLLKTDADKETYELAVEVLEQVIEPEMTDYEKELAIHDWLCYNINFDKDSLTAIGSAMAFSDTPYGALKYHSAVCVGYATTFRLLTTMVGLECDIIHDSDYSHTWNIIKLDDGEYYLVDVYSDVSDKDFCTHTSFNVTEEQLGFTWDFERYPRANGEKYSYASMSAVDFETLEEILDACLAISQNGGELYFRANDSLTVADISFILSGIESRVSSRDNAYATAGLFTTSTDNPVYSLTVSIWEDDNWGGEDIDFGELTIDTTEMNEKLNKLFGMAGCNNFENTYPVG